MQGRIHPISQVIHRAVEIFNEMGFTVAEGPELETDYYNFDALNIPPDHPARDMWDTFWIGSKLLRTQTSPVQIRYMEKHRPPFRIVAPGRVFRREATNATHDCQFHQLEGLAVDRAMTLAHMKAFLEAFFQKFFDANISLRLRPSYFPFVEPGLELDFSCFRCVGNGCALCKQTGWIEVAGAGMVHPAVLSAGRINSGEWQGFAFGMGLERLAMLKWGINDLRLFPSGDLRFLNQFIV